MGRARAEATGIGLPVAEADKGDVKEVLGDVKADRGSEAKAANRAKVDRVVTVVTVGQEA